MYKFTDNAMESGVAVCDTDITNDNFMHLKYSDKSDFICEAPNGVLSYSELTITAPSGLKVALAKGKDDNKAMVSSLLILNDPVSLEVTGEYSGASVFINENKELAIKKREETQDPTVTSASASDVYLYNTKTNFYYDENGQTLVIGRLGEIYSTVGAIQGIAPKEVFRATDYQEYANALTNVLSELKAEKVEIDAARATLDRLYKGVNLADKFASEIANYSDQWAWIKARIQAGNFTGIHVGDYLPFKLNAGTAGGKAIAAQDFNAEIAGIDTYYGYGDTPVNHHIDFVTKTVIDTEITWNPADNNNGTSIVPQPWLASQVYAWLNGVNNYNTANAYNKVAHGMNAANAGIYQLLPQALRNVIVQKRQILGQRYSASGLLTYDTTWAWGDMGYLWLPNEVEVYGCQIASAAHYNGGTYIHESMGAVQYPLFACHGGYNGRVKKTSTGARSPWWLSAVYGGNATSACFVNDNGYATANTTSLAGIRVPVCFRIG